MFETLLTSLKETLTSPVDLFVLGVLAFFVWKYVLSKYFRRDDLPVPELHLPPMKKQDLTLEELRQYDGTGADGRLLVAVNGKVYDVTRAKHLYGKEGPYGLFAGRDASRGLATFSTDPSSVKDEYDDLSDLSTYELDSMKEWAEQFSEKYAVVGRLLKLGEAPHKYESDDEENSFPSSGATSKDKDKEL